MNHVEVIITLSPYIPFNEIFIAQLAEIGFESFSEEIDNNQLRGYIPEGNFNRQIVEGIIKEYSENVNYTIDIKTIPRENWNKKWEENFHAVEVGEFCRIRAPFHDFIEGFDHEIIIEPKMSFGTGHHQTTKMMIKLMQEVDFKEKIVLDMGSGTGVLGILAKRLGAKEVIAVDIEEWAYENMRENFLRNEVGIAAHQGGIEVLHNLNRQYDIILANINRNVLLTQFDAYHHYLKKSASLLLSGFYEHDIEVITNHPPIVSYKLEKQIVMNDWCALNLLKQ